MRDQSLELYKTVFESLHIGIKVWHLEDESDPGSLRLIASNEAAAQATGVPRALVVGKTIAEGFPDAVSDGIAAAFAEVAVSGKPKDLGEIVYSDPRVREGVFSVFAVPLPNRSVAVAFQNITKQQLQMSSVERKADFVELLQEVAVAANEAKTSDEAFEKCLRDVCEHTGWPVGHVFRRSLDPEDGLEATSTWYLDDPERYGAFRDVTLERTIEPGVGLPGRVLETGQAEWVVDVQFDERLPFGAVAQDLGVRAGFAFPVLVGSEVAAVMEFYSAKTLVPDQLLLDVMRQVGIQLGRVIERERAWSVANPL